MTDIVIQGIGGRMGHVLCDMIAQREDCRVIAGIDIKDGKQNGIPVYDSLEKLDGKGDVIIDFSSPAAVEKALPYCEAHKLPIVVCTTGLSEESSSRWCSYPARCRCSRALICLWASMCCRSCASALRLFWV